MTFDDFIKKYDGKGVDYDGHYGYQCMDLYRQYVNEVLKFPQSPAVTGAKDVWNTYLKDYYTRIDNTPDGVPENGDVVIWGETLGPYGHIAICISADTKSFQSFDQNFPAGSLCKVVKHDYKHVLGWFRPKVTQEPQENILLKLLTENGIDTEGELREVIGHHIDHPIIITDKANMSKEITQLKEQARVKDQAMEELNKDLKACKVQNEELRKQYEDFLNKLIKKLNPLEPGNDEATVLGEIDRLISTEDGSDDTNKKLTDALKTIDELNAKLADKKEVVNYKALPTLNQIMKLILLKFIGR